MLNMLVILTISRIIRPISLLTQLINRLTRPISLLTLSLGLATVTAEAIMAVIRLMDGIMGMEAFAVVIVKSGRSGKAHG
jgi:hypothetical protein